MASEVTYTNLASEVRNNIIDLITYSNIPDPIVGSSSESRKWIYSRQPDVKANDFQGYPYLIVPAVDVDIEPEGGSVDGKYKTVYFECEVEVRTSDRGYGGNNGNGLTYMDSITNNFIKTFNNITNRNTLRSNSLQFANMITSSVGTETINNELVYIRTITLSFNRRIQISA